MKRKGSPLRLGLALVAVCGMAVAGCDTDSILEVKDPDLVLPENVQGEKGAELFWAGALGQFANAYSSNGGGQVMYVGMFTDEFHLSGTFPTRNEVDRREIDEQNTTMEGQYLRLHQARVGAENAVVLMEEFLAGDSRIAELYSLAGFTYLMFGENYCSGVPYGSTPGSGDPIDGTQSTTDETWGIAAARFSSAATAAGADANQANLAAIGQGRTLLNQGMYAAAAAAVAGVPTDWVYLIRSADGGAASLRNAIYNLNQSQRRWSVSDVEGGNGIAFRSAEDVRMPLTPYVDAVGFDEATPLYEQLKYPSHEDDTPLANGVEARLIQAEAEFHAANYPAMYAFLNDLRGDVSLPDLVDPGNDDARIDDLFEERARWLFATSHRLGDMRRLIRQYGRDSETVFPTGAYFKGGNYGPDVNFIIPFTEYENSNIDRAQPLCLNRGA